MVPLEKKLTYDFLCLQIENTVFILVDIHIEERVKMPMKLRHDNNLSITPA
jgi:hypothetical protein